MVQEDLRYDHQRKFALRGDLMKQPILWTVALTVMFCAAVSRGQRGGDVSSEAQSAIAGTIDIHVHSDPDDRPRSIDAIDVAKLARTRRMRAIVLKNHYDPTGPLAYIIRKEVPGIEVFGGIDLNLTVGGMNVAAVEHMTKVTGGWGRFVWMSTFDAENQVRYSKEDRPSVRVARDGELLTETKAVIGVIARNGLVLATGHVSPEEALLMFREGKRQGVQHMVVTHAMTAPVLMNIAQMQEAAKLGAFIEFVGGSLSSADAATRMDAFAEAIRKVGPEFCILSSDLGQRGNPLPPDGFGEFLVALRRRGFSQQEIDRMSKENPARLLGIH